MNTNVKTTAITNFLTEDNYRKIEREFLKHADLENYQDTNYDDQNGLTLEWGRYGYSATEQEQEDDLIMLEKAAANFNNEFLGKFIAFVEEEDKVNCVYLMDIKQLSQHYQYKGEIEYCNTRAHKKALELIKQNFQ
jgi:hypothetical protein